MRRWSLSDLALARPVTVGMLLLAVFLLGAIALAKLPLAFLPSESVSRVRIRVDINNNSPEVLEREVIRPLEDSVAGIRDINRMRVTSGTWGVNLRLEFRPGTDIDTRKMELRERIDRVRAELPDDVENIELVSSQGAADEPVMRVRIASDKRLDDEYYLIDSRVVRAIERIEGVARVELEGVEPHELEIGVDLDAARGHGIELQTIGDAVRQSRLGRSLGTLRRSDRDAGVRSPGTPAEPERYGAIPLLRGESEATPEALPEGLSSSDPLAQADLTTREPAAGSGTAGREPSFAPLREVAAVELHPKELRRGNRLNGRPAINLEVYADAGASPVTVSAQVRGVIAGLRGDSALGGLDVSVFHDQGAMILDTLTDLRDTGLYGGLIGILVLFGFLHRWRSTLIAAICIPLSVLATCGVLFLQGGELNCIVLLGLVLCVGMLIDNAVVIVEAIALRRQLGDTRAVAAQRGAREVGLATVASTLSSVIVFLPMVLAGGHGEIYTYMRPLGGTFVIALISSLLVSQLAVPLLMTREWPQWRGQWRRRRNTARSEPPAEPRPARNYLLEPIARVYASFVSWTIRHPRLTLVVGLLACLSAIYPAKRLKIDMGMNEEQVDMPIRLELRGSRDFKAVEEKVIVAEKALLARADEVGIDTLSCSYRDWGASCYATSKQDIQSERDMSDFKQRISAALPEQAGVNYHVGERDGWWMRNRDPREVQFVLRGEDMNTLFELAEEFAEHLRANLSKGDPAQPDAGGYDTISGPFNEGNQELHVRLDSERLRQLGLRAESVAQRVSLAFRGAPLGQVRGRQGEVELRLSTSALPRQPGALAGEVEATSPGLAELGDLRIALPAGRADGITEVPLSTVATIGISRSPSWIQRVDRQTEARMKVRFFSPDAEANRAAVETARASFVLPDGYSFGQATPWGRDQREMFELAINLGLCLILVYAVMASLFESFLQPGAILATGLLGCFGAPWALWATQTTFDLVAMIGLFILIGIIVNNGIMLIDKVTQLRAQGVPRDQALAQAGRERLRPVLMTAMTTIFGLVPMLIHHPTLAGVYYHSIAIIIAAGMATSTVMTLVFLPSAYVLVETVSLEARRVWLKLAGR